MAAVKQVIVVRKDLKMRRGKEIAQGSHASMEWMMVRFQKLLAGDQSALQLTPEQSQWLRAGVAKVCVRVDSEDELHSVHQKARDAGLESHLIVDSGRTEFNGIPTPTACAIGPDDAQRIDAITGALSLY